MLGRKAIHLLREEDRKKVPELRELHIDIGAQRAARRRVRWSASATSPCSPASRSSSPTTASCRARWTTASVRSSRSRRPGWSPKPGGAPGEVAAAAVVQEEIGDRRRADRARSALEPDVAIVVDVTHETGTPGVDVNEIGNHKFGDRVR